MDKVLVVEGKGDGEEVVEKYETQCFHHCHEVRKGANGLLNFLCFWLNDILEKTQFSKLLFLLSSHPP